MLNIFLRWQYLADQEFKRENVEKKAYKCLRNKQRIRKWYVSSMKVSMFTVNSSHKSETGWFKGQVMLCMHNYISI